MEAVGAAGAFRRTNFAVASTASPGALAGGGKVGVGDFGLLSTSAPTPTLRTAAAVHLGPTRPGVVGVPDAMLDSVFARTSTTLATLGRTPIGTRRVGASDVTLVSAFAQAPTPWRWRECPMAIGMGGAPCVADLMLTTMLMQATLDDPAGARERTTRRMRVREGLGGRWTRTSLHRSLRNLTRATRPACVGPLPELIDHAASDVVTCSMSCVVAFRVLDPMMAMALTRQSHFISRARGPRRGCAAAPTRCRPPGAAAEQGDAARGGGPVMMTS